MAVADHLHFGRAAAELHVSQPALSASLAGLESCLGVQLVERTTRRVLMTPLGREVAERSRQVIADVEDIVDVAAAAHGELTGTLRLGVIPTVAPYLLPRLLPGLRASHPGLRLQLREEQTDPLLTGLTAGRLDVLLLALPAVPDGRGGPELHAEPLYDESFVLLGPEGMPLAGRADLVPDDLEGLGVLLLEDGHCLRQQALDVCRSAGAREDDAVRATSLTTLVQMVAGGLGVTLLPEAAVAVEARPGGGTATASFAEPAPSRRIGLVWRATSARAAAYGQLADTLRRLVRRHRLPVRVLA